MRSRLLEGMAVGTRAFSSSNQLKRLFPGSDYMVSSSRQVDRMELSWLCMGSAPKGGFGPEEHSRCYKVRCQMSDRSLAGLLAVVAVVWLVSSPVAGQSAAPDTSSAPRTTWGDPDLQGIWANDVSTPLERPSRFAGKAELSEEELALFTEERQASREDRDRRDAEAGTVTDVGRAYNAHWFPVPGNPIERTSLITDPPNGRVPPLTSQARERFAAWAQTKGFVWERREPKGVALERRPDG